MLKIWLPVGIVGVGYFLGCMWFVYQSHKVGKELPTAIKFMIFLGGLGLLAYLAEAILDTLGV
jgi:hypothetical protein